MRSTWVTPIFCWPKTHTTHSPIIVMLITRFIFSHFHVVTINGVKGQHIVVFFLMAASYFKEKRYINIYYNYY